MKKWLLLLLIPMSLFAKEYYSDIETQEFSVSIENCSQEGKLSSEGSVTLRLSYPSGFEIKTIAYDYDETSFKWGDEKILKESIVDEKKETILQLSYEPQLAGNHYLNLPTLHLVSIEDHKKFVTFHPPLIDYLVKDDIDLSKTKLYPKGLLGLDLKKLVEMDLKNTQNLQDQVRDDLAKAKLQLEGKGFQKFLSMLFVFVIVAFSGYQIFKMIKKRSGLKEILGYYKDPREIAKKELEILKKKSLPQKGYFEDFYVELTQIVRSYIEKQYEVKAPEQTTQEFLNEVISKPIFEKDMKLHLEEFLKFADLVKFARHSPEIKECEAAEDKALSFIEAASPNLL